MSLSNWTDQEITRQLDSGNSWSGLIFTYAFPTSSSGLHTTSGEGRGFVELDASQRQSAELALQLWDDLISQSISRVVSGLSDIEFGMSNTGVDYAHAYYPTIGSVWFNYENPELNEPQVGDYGFSTYIHEIGHALGLEHAGDYNGEGDWTPLYFEDSTVYSIMSYFGPDHQSGEDLVGWGNWADTNGTLYSPQTPMLNDVMALQAIYGADTHTRSGDSIYGFSSNIIGQGLESIYDFSINLNPVLCIYDAGGTDTLDLSGWAADSSINLTAGALSSCNGMTNNLSIARNAVIENLTTGSGNDTLSGNAADNLLISGVGNDLLIGGLGHDSLDGGLGFDTAQYQHLISDYSFQYSGGVLTITDQTAGRDGLDTLTDIDQLIFAGWTGGIEHKTASPHDPILNFVGQLGQYQVSGNTAQAVVVDHVTGREAIQLLTDYQRLHFIDLNVGLDSAFGENAGMAYRLYKAAFDRTPDLGGVGYWIYRIDNGLSLNSVAQEFINSGEFRAMYGSNPTDAQFVTLLYEHVMHRSAEGEGFNFWVNALSPQGGWSRAGVLAYFSESEENLGQTAELVANGIQYFEYAV